MRIALRFVLVSALATLLASAASADTRTYAAALNGDQEVPAVTTNAAGGAAMSLDTVTKILTYSVIYTNLSSETAAHIHGPAAVGVNANVLFPLPLGTPKLGFIGPLTDQQIADLDAGLWYVNVHTTAHSGGEIRGQINLLIAVEPQTWSAVKALYHP
jgi:hypothetical protein